MAAEVGTAYVTIMPSARGFARRLRGETAGPAAAAGRSSGKRFSGGIIGSVKGIAGPLTAIFAGIGLGRFFKDAVGAASDFNEEVSKTGVTFGKQALPAVLKFADGAARSLGQSKTAALDAANTFATFGKSAGLSGQELVRFSTDLTVLASDLASFNNTTPEEAVLALGAGLRGESEPLRRFGVLLNEATLRERALKLGITSTTKDALTPQQRVLAAQAEIFAQTGDAQGDFARTSDGLANKQRILSATFENLKTRLGAVFLPAALAVTSFLANNLEPAFNRLSAVAQRFGALLSPAITSVKTALTGLIPAGTGVAGIIDRIRNSTPQLQANFAQVRALFATIGATVMSVLRPALATLSQVFREQILPALLRFAEQTAPLRAALLSVAGVVVRVGGALLRVLLPPLIKLIGFVLVGLLNGLGLVLGTVGRVAQALISFGAAVANRASPAIRALAKFLRGPAATAARVLGRGARIVAGIIGGVFTARIRSGAATVRFFGRAVTAGFRLVSAGARRLASTVASGFSRIVSRVRSAASSIVSALRRPASRAAGIGRLIVRGLIRGIRALSGQAASAARRVVTNALNRAKRALRISSPSREWEQIGRASTGGFVRGLDATRSDAIRAAERLVAIPGQGRLFGADIIPDPRRGDGLTVHQSITAPDPRSAASASVRRLRAEAYLAGLL